MLSARDLRTITLGAEAGSWNTVWITLQAFSQSSNLYRQLNCRADKDETYQINTPKETLSLQSQRKH
jgi:hypothetical protein